MTPFLSYKVVVPDNKSRNIPEVVLVRRWVVGVLGIWKEGVGGTQRGDKGELAKGSKKPGELRHVYI